MKKLILSITVSVIFALSACSSPADETVTAIPDHALISHTETGETTTAKESTSAERSSQPEVESAGPGLPGGIRAGYIEETREMAEPSGEDYVTGHEDTGFSDSGYYAPPAAQPAPARQESETRKPEAEPQSTACRHESIYVSGACPATCISSGYSGDTYCAVCGALIDAGYSTGYADHSWISETVHEDAYLTCYCGLIFTGADDHDAHVNEMVSAGGRAADHGCVWTPGRDYTIYTCSVCGAQLNN